MVEPAAILGRGAAEAVDARPVAGGVVVALGAAGDDGDVRAGGQRSVSIGPAELRAVRDVRDASVDVVYGGLRARGGVAGGERAVVEIVSSELCGVSDGRGRGDGGAVFDVAVDSGHVVGVLPDPGHVAASVAAVAGGGAARVYAGGVLLVVAGAGVRGRHAEPVADRHAGVVFLKPVDLRAGPSAG